MAEKQNEGGEVDKGPRRMVSLGLAWLAVGVGITVYGIDQPAFGFNEGGTLVIPVGMQLIAVAYAALRGFDRATGYEFFRGTEQGSGS